MSDDSTRPQDDSADAVAPPPATPVPDELLAAPPASDTPVPEGLLTPPPPAEIAPADAVIPPPPADAELPATRSARRRPAVLADDAPSAVADDWARPSVAPQDPDPGSYRGLAVAVFAVLVLLLAGAVAAAVYLATSVGLPFAADAVAAPISTASALLS
ncbi:hypothetical protein [Microbacterium hydrocarbonoxydans]|uniref:hypothetical protein n=1 Tax=Microbacterium hydrocarbonoxydans TaxID=273678 RepID=UPI00203DF162|nr:hypothetical protein [Microbacterium hydrocarbonoxydans]MCM3778880.1 hypothetical protein [Microbacterium hydrocarbonoxydans]